MGTGGGVEGGDRGGVEGGDRGRGMGSGCCKVLCCVVQHCQIYCSDRFESKRTSSVNNE